MTMFVLGVDTSGPVTSLGIGDGHGPGPRRSIEGGRKHAEVIDQALIDLRSDFSSAIPQAVCVGVGPGPYSGLRVGVAFALGLSRAWAVPLVGMCSLDVIAWAHVNSAGSEATDDFVVTADARRRELYWARYDARGMRTQGPYVVLADDLEVDVPVVANAQVDPSMMAHRAACLLEQGVQLAAIDDAWGPHGSDGSDVSVPAGPLLPPRPLYLRAPDITWSQSNAPGAVL